MASLVNLLSILFPILQRYSPPIEKKCEEEPQQTLDLKFGDQLKMKSTTWLNFFLLAVPAHNLFRCARRKLVFHRTIERKLNLTGRCQRVHSFSIVTSWKNYFSCKKNYLLSTVRTWWQSKRVSAFLQQLLIFFIGSLYFLGGSQYNDSLYFMSSVFVSNQFSSVETMTKQCCFVYVYKAPYNWLPEQMTAMAVIKNGR